jgi:hypothetical protein
VKKVLKWLAYIAAAFIVLVSLVAGLTQTQFFRERLRSFALTELDSLLDADVSLGEIRGNLISGFSIDSVSIRVQNHLFVTAERLNIRYDVFEIPSKKINVNVLTLVRPQIALLRGRDSVWNFERIVRPTPDDPASTPFDWPIAVGRFEIIGGTMRLIDSASLAETDHVFTDSYFVEYHNFAVRNLNLLVTAVLVTPTEKRAKISALSFDSGAPDVHLKKLSGEFRVTTHEAVVKNMVLQTSRSDLRLDATMKDIDLLGGIELSDLKSKPVELSLRTKDLDFGELKRFIHQLDFLEGRLTADIVADGEFGILNVGQIDLKTRGSELHFAGFVSNLHEPENLALSIKCRESTLHYGDVLALMPTFELPDYSVLGPTKLDFDFDGEPLDFTTSLSVQSAYGRISTKGATLKIGGEETLQYNGEFAAEGLRLVPLLNDERFDGQLNAVVKVIGSGTSLDNLNATLEAHIDSSEFAGDRVGPSRIQLSCLNKKLTGAVDLSIGTMKSQLHAELDRANAALPSFKVEGNVASLNLADFLNDASHNSNLTLDLKAEGTGLVWEKLSGSVMLDFLSSRYREYQIDSTLINVTINQHDPLKSSITLTSALADFSINGQFDLDYMVGLIRYEADNLRLAIGRRFASLDTNLATSLDVKELETSAKRLAAMNKMLDARYELTVKNLEPLSILTANRTFDAVGTIKGLLRGNYDDLTGEAQLQLKEFFYGNADSGMLVQDGVASLRFNDLKPINPLSELTLRVRVDAGKMHLNRTKLDTLNFGIFYDKEYAGFVVQADYDQDFHLRTNGQVGVADDGVQFTLTNLTAAFKDFAWRADDGSVVAINQSGMRVQNVNLRRDSALVAIRGSVRTGGAFDATLQCTNMNLDDLKYVLRREEHGISARAFEGILNLDARASGTFAAPVYDAKLSARHVFFRGFPFGEIEGTLNYRNEELAATLTIDNRSDRTKGVPDLIVEGMLPINLALTDVGERLSERQMDFKVYTDGLQMSLLDPLLPTFNELSGTLKADIKVGGSPKKPNFKGTMSITGSSFLFEPNKMHYKLDGTYQPDGERIKVLTTTIRNIASDNKPGREGVIFVTGDLALRELIPSDFNFDIKGQLLVVNKNTRTSSLAVYGELPVQVAQRGLRFTGNIDHSVLKGDVLVKNSTLAFPPTTAASREDTFFIPFRVVDDIPKQIEATDQNVVSRYFSLALNRRRSGELTSGNGARTPSFIDGLRYDLNVEFAGSNNEVRMIFNPATNEELVANITGKVAITEEGKTWGGILDVSRASYNFYGKRFDAEGTISYAGDFLNPELNITATYEGTRKYDDKAETREERVVVTYKITGTRFAPTSEIRMRIDDVDYYSYRVTPTSNDVQSDALTFIITNNFPLSRGERNNIAEQVGPTVGSGLVGGATSLLTSTLAEFLRNKTGFINSFEFRYSSGQSADIRLGGTAFKGYWRYGGKILEDPINNANFSILYSFGDIFDRPSLRNFMFELERKVDTSTLFGSIETRKEINSARFFYRISF